MIRAACLHPVGAFLFVLFFLEDVSQWTQITGVPRHEPTCRVSVHRSRLWLAHEAKCSLFGHQKGVGGQQLLTISFTLKHYFNFHTTKKDNHKKKTLPRETANLSSLKDGSSSCHSLNAHFWNTSSFILRGTATNNNKDEKTQLTSNLESYNNY